MSKLQDLSIQELMSLSVEEEEYEPLVDLSGSNDFESGGEEESPLDLLSIVLRGTDSESKSNISDEEDIFGLKDILLNKQNAMNGIKLQNEKIKKGKMSEEQLESITKRNTNKQLISVSIREQVDCGLLQSGINKIWEIDGEYQRDILYGFMKDIREIPERFLNDYVDRLQGIGAFFNPNNDYMREVFGDAIMQFQYGIYSDEENKYTMRLMMPLRFFDNSIVGFVGYSPVENVEGRTIKYLYPKKDVLEKSRILATETEVMRKAIKDGYICLTDGYFDAFSLNVYGINAASLCGSAVTKFHKLFLSKIKTKIIIPDNDAAGTKLERTVKGLWKNSRAIHQIETKDIDDYLHKECNILNFKDKFEDWRLRGFIGDLML